MADQTKLFGAMPGSTKGLGRLAFIPVDIRDLQDGTLAGRTTLGALGTQFLKGIRSGKFILIGQVGHTIEPTGPRPAAPGPKVPSRTPTVTSG